MSIPVAFVPEIEIEEREVVLASVQRTAPRFPTYGPGDGRDWHQYFVDLKASAQPAEEEEEPEATVAITTPAYDLSVNESAALNARSAPAQLVKRLRTAGWEVTVRRSVADVAAVLYLNDSDEDAAEEHRKGDVRYAAHELETLAVIGIKRNPAGNPALVVDAAWTSKGGFSGATTFDPVLGQVWRSTVAKPRKPREWEKAAGAQPPWGLTQWMDAVCPKPEPKAKKEAA
jgi:hypothetical protein